LKWGYIVDDAVSNKSLLSNIDKLSSRENFVNLKIEESGNSDVDVNVMVEVDTMPIAFAILIAQWSSRQLSDKDFKRAIQKLEDLTEQHNKNKKTRDNNDLSNVRIFGRK
jgi:hypothetical protein